jgi:hypothetical protein
MKEKLKKLDDDVGNTANEQEEMIESHSIFVIHIQSTSK